MAKINIKYKNYPKFPRDCKAIAKVIVPKLIEKDKLIVVNIIEQETHHHIYHNNKRVYGQSCPRTGVIDLFLNEIYDEARSEEHNRYRFLKVLIHEYYHLKLGFGKPLMLGNEKISFRELQEFYVERLTFDLLKNMNTQLGIDIGKDPFNINAKNYKCFIAESEAYLISKIINKFNSLDMDNKVKLNSIFTSTIRRVMDVLTEEMQYYFDNGYGFIDRSDSWKEARDNENKAKLKAERDTETESVSSKQ